MAVLLTLVNQHLADTAAAHVRPSAQQIAPPIVRLMKAIPSQRDPKVLVNGNAPNVGDFFPTTPTKAMAGRVYSISGSTAPAGTIVKLFRQSDDLKVQQTTTDAGGFYVFPRDVNDTNAYYVIAYTTSNTPQIHGVSDRGGVPV